MHAGERQLHLRFHPPGLGHPHVRRRPGHVLQQRRLTHPPPTPHPPRTPPPPAPIPPHAHQRPPASQAQIPQQAIERRPLALAVQQPRHRLRWHTHAPPPTTSPPARRR